MNNKPFSITESTFVGDCKLFVKGSVDSKNSNALLLRLERVLSDGNEKIILNMSEVDYLSSIGIRAILKTYKDAKSQGKKFYIEKPSEVVTNILGMAALSDMLIR